MLTEKSEFFKAACRNEWKEATSRVVKLPEVDDDAFRSYLVWVYREKVAIREGPRSNTTEEFTDAERMVHGRSVHTSLAKLWILADRLADMRLRNAVIDKLVAGLSDGFEGNIGMLYFPPELTTLVWSNTTADRPLRRLVLDYYIAIVWSDEVKAHWDDFQLEFMKDLAIAAMEKDERSEKKHYRPREIVHKYRRCYYHEHSEECPDCPSV